MKFIEEDIIEEFWQQAFLASMNALIIAGFPPETVAMQAGQFADAACKEYKERTS